MSESTSAESRFLSFEELLAALEDRQFERPPAVVANAHVTGLGVARSLSANGVPVVALDRTPDGVAPGSTAVEFAGRITYPLDDPEGFGRDLERLAEAVEGRPVAFGCMDEWVHGLADADPDGVRLPFAGREVIDRVLDKTDLYARCERLGVPYPETYRIEAAGVDGDGPPVRSAEEAASELGFPLVVKPALKRTFEEAMGTNVLELEDAEAYHEIVAEAAARGIRLMAQERVDVAVGEDRSVASYRAPDGETTAMVGNAAVRHPRGFGTSCLVRPLEDETLEQRALAVLSDAGYHGISESEFVYDADRGTYVLLDVNTRPWKWIGLPVATGRNLPMAAYAAATGADYEPGPDRRPTWVYLADYLSELSAGTADALDRASWLALVSGSVDGDDGVVTGVYDPDDPAPTYQLLRTEFGSREYYCSC
jgi:predicted ATP-grasp superfamily ATP-dependent carboligase